MSMNFGCLFIVNIQDVVLKNAVRFINILDSFKFIMATGHRL